MKKIFLILGIALSVLSCSSPLDKKFNEESLKEDFKVIESDLDSIEYKLLIGNILRLKIQNIKIENMTYGEILENAKEWKLEQEKVQIEQKAIAEKALKIEQEKIDLLSKSVLVTCFSKGFTKYDYQDYITYKFVIKNQSDKNIRAIKGSITFNNLFNEKIKSLNFVYDQPIKSNTTANYNAQTDYNQFIDSDSSLKNKDLKDIKVVWKPEKIIFEDGTTLE